VLTPLSESLLDGMLPMQKIIEGLESFLEKEKQHINFEEGQLFPKIEELANAKDWEKLAKESWLKTDAMFHKFDSNHYAELYSELEEAIAN
jgi:hemerythrin-like domain-containing protein